MKARKDSSAKRGAETTAGAHDVPTPGNRCSPAHEDEVKRERYRAYQREYQRERAVRRRADYMRGAACVKCGSTERLELDHIDPAEKTSHKIWSWSDARIRAEMAKCQWLCAPCHHEKTRLQRFGERKHGTMAMYKRGKCRCDDCRAANRERLRGIRERRRATGTR